MTLRSRRDLERAGMRRRAIERALRDGSLIRVRPGWYADRSTDADVITAARCGGSVSCGSALRRHGVWTASRRELHVRVDADRHVLRRGPVVHRHAGDCRDGVDTVITALRVASHCLPADELVCAFDSALHAGLVTRSALLAELDGSRGRQALARSDGRSESGIETLARLRLRARRIRLRIQVPIEGIGRVDMVVGDRLVIELDGDAWHSSAEQREADRRRDSALVALGYLVIRAGYRRVMDDWSGFEAEVLRIVRRREHRWRAIHRADHRVR